MADIEGTEFYELEEGEGEPKKPGFSKKQLMIVGIVVGILIVLVLVAIFVSNALRQRRAIQVEEERVLQEVEENMIDAFAECEDAEDVERCKEMVRTRLAREMGEAVVCQGLEGQMYKNCVELIAFDNLDESVCEFLSSEEASACKDSVYSRQASAAKDYSLCGKISEEEKRANCEAILLPHVISQDACEAFGVDLSVCEGAQNVGNVVDAGDPSGCATFADDILRQECDEAFETIDMDKDGLILGEEFEAGTSDDNPDSDGDGLSDGDEVYVYETDPLNPDTDGDGFPDGVEVEGGYDPLQ
ncbi:hypothetical protein IH979_00735 [Patescibacteria group bacterium]|nr:hypothetical protein [Patescibacteria group bacterium]